MTGEQADVIRARLIALAADADEVLRDDDPALAALASLEAHAATGCEFGCGPEPDDGSHVGGPGFGVVPACPVHGWVCALLEARPCGGQNCQMLVAAEARVASLEAERDALVATLERIAAPGRLTEPYGVGSETSLDGEVVAVQMVRVVSAAEVAREALGARLAQAERQEEVSEPGIPLGDGHTRGLPIEDIGPGSLTSSRPAVADTSSAPTIPAPSVPHQFVEKGAGSDNYELIPDTRSRTSTE